jgi:ABC-type glycerol-3-phosphate transport system substrate-binding protein
MISKFSKKKEAALDFAKFLLTDESQEVFYATGGFYPVVSSFYQNPENIRRYPEIPEIQALMVTGVHRPQEKDYTKNSKIMAHYFTLAMRRKLTVDEAVKGATQAIRSEQVLSGVN